jgi:hypothetical protein
MQPEQPKTLDYATPRPKPPSGILRVICGFILGWFLGVLISGALADLYAQATQGHHHHDGTIYFITTRAIVLEAPMLTLIRMIAGTLITGRFAFFFGLASGPLILGAIILLA